MSKLLMSKLLGSKLLISKLLTSKLSMRKQLVNIRGTTIDKNKTNKQTM